MKSFTILLATASIATAALVPRQASSASTASSRASSSSSSSGPDYFQTTPQLFPGPTKTGVAPFLAQTNPAPFGNEASFVPNTPLETALPIVGNTNNTSIFGLMGQLTPYTPNPDGFGANEYPLPPGANISLINVIHRHGSRYPTGDSSVSTFGSKLVNLTANGTAKFTGNLTFLNTWKYNLGAEILVPRGRQELYDSGVLFYYNYARLYNTSTKIIARTPTQDRMLKSAENFMAGFFGLEWVQNATLETIIEQPFYNNTLAGYFQCNNSNNFRSAGGANASASWAQIYLKNATARFRNQSGNYNWTVSDTYNAQTLCPYETVAYGYSAFCDLFTFDEWKGFEYSIDLSFFYSNMFGSPTGRAVGIGYVEEVYARLQNKLYDLPIGATQVNRTLDTMNTTFPLNQTLYFDFSHDTNIASVITAFGLTQFNQTLPTTGPPPKQQMIVSHITPFGTRLVLEVIKAPAPVKPVRPTAANATTADFYGNGSATSYVHMILNQRTIPLNASYAACGKRDDGWCELSTFMNILSTKLTEARYAYSCFANYPAVPFGGNVTDGTPTTKRSVGEEDKMMPRMVGRGALSGLEFVSNSDKFWSM